MDPFSPTSQAYASFVAYLTGNKEEFQPLEEYQLLVIEIPGLEVDCVLDSQGLTWNLKSFESVVNNLNNEVKIQ